VERLPQTVVKTSRSRTPGQFGHHSGLFLFQLVFHFCKATALLQQPGVGGGALCVELFRTQLQLLLVFLLVFQLRGTNIDISA